MQEHVFKPTIVTYRGHYADDHLVDGRELGSSLSGFTRTANVITNFYLDGKINLHPNSQKVRYYVGVPKENGVLYELIALMQTGHLPVYTPALIELASEFLPAIWRAIIEKSLGRRSESEAMLEIIKEMAERKDEFASKVHDGHMRDKAWLQDHIDQLSGKMRTSLEDAATPVGRSVKSEKLWPGQEFETEIDEQAADVLRSRGADQVGDQVNMILRLRAVNLDTGSGQAEIVGEEGNKLFVKITDPALQTPENIYSHSLDQQTAIHATVKPTLRDGEIAKIFISDAKEAS
ncbi:MAG: hypothetical protein RH946_14200 [Rhodospirillales bacterium]